MSHDAAVLLQVAGRSVLHTNDARLSLAQTRRAAAEVGAPIDLMGLQMSGASWHPVCYEYDDVDRERISEPSGSASSPPYAAWCAGPRRGW